MSHVYLGEGSLMYYICVAVRIEIFYVQIQISYVRIVNPDVRIQISYVRIEISYVRIQISYVRMQISYVRIEISYVRIQISQGIKDVRQQNLQMSTCSVSVPDMSHVYYGYRSLMHYISMSRYADTDL